MSNALAIAAVTDTLLLLLRDGMKTDIQNLEITARLPDKARDGFEDKLQVNLFLYHLTLNAALRNQPYPNPSNPSPLPLNLFYLVTAYEPNNNEVVSHLLLGRALRILHDEFTLDKNLISQSVQNANLPFPLNQLEEQAVDLQDQIDQVDILPEMMSIDEMSKLWTTFQTQYRPSAAIQASVVIIESHRASKAAPPVLKRGAQDQGIFGVVGRTPNLLEIRTYNPADKRRFKPAAQSGDLLGLVVDALEGDTTFRFTRTGPIEQILKKPNLPGDRRTVVFNGQKAIELNTEIALADGWAPGIYLLTLLVANPEVPLPWPTNAIPFALAARVSAINAGTAEVGMGRWDVTLTLECRPRLLTGQHVTLLFGDSMEVKPDSDPAPVADPTQPSVIAFTIPNQPAGQYLIRLRVDSVDSLPVDFSQNPPVIAADQQVTVP